MKKVSAKLKKVARKAWANKSIRRLVVVGVVGLVGLTGLEISSPTVEALGAALMLFLSV